MRNGIDHEMARHARDKRERGMAGHEARYSRSDDRVGAQDHLADRRDVLV
jgi:hypothetical protein